MFFSSCGADRGLILSTADVRSSVKIHSRRMVRIARKADSVQVISEPPPARMPLPDRCNGIATNRRPTRPTMAEPSILIVGAGPVGMTLAALLAQYGIRPRIVDKRAAPSDGSKALAVNAASLKVLDRIGIAQRIVEHGERIHDIHVYLDGTPIVHIDCARARGTPYPFSIALPQPETERILSAHLLGHGIAVERPVSLNAVHDGGDRVDVTLENGRGSVEHARFDYVVGCDGSRSTVRTSLGIDFLGRDYRSFMLLIDAHIDWPFKRAGHADYFVRDSGFIIVIPLPDGLYRIVMSENGGDLRDMKRPRTIDDYQRIVDRYATHPLRLRNVVWESQAPLYNRLASRFGNGRVLLAGDAAHLFSPIGGLGMNTGIQDAANLAWRLAGVAKGGYATTVLDAYRTERRQMAERLVASTDETTSLITRDGSNLAERARRWMPAMENRPSLRRAWPLAFTGLGQRYDSDADAGHPLVGVHVPFATAHDGHGAPIDTYRLSRGWRPLIVAFARTFGDGVERLRAAAREAGLDVFAVVAQPGSPADAAHTIVDAAHAYRDAFGARDGDVFVLRPDGYIADVACIDMPDDCLARALRVFAPADADEPVA
ncbi:NAD(P)-binding protein [Burkholderia ambifaria]|uniref:FAD-dependent monooxygenase n=1 Tax=Burkholderia ambifaria TaxID=152480 RepID=UPI0013FD7E7B|nr:FAD-dependent monooxygenase [Burkholderia ambifaria]NHL70386.1 NAD(P)-binding protein [Burkholderia ambifaria]